MLFWRSCLLLLDLFSERDMRIRAKLLYYNAEANKIEHYTLKPFEPRTLRLGVGYSFCEYIYTYGDSKFHADGPHHLGWTSLVSTSTARSNPFALIRHVEGRGVKKLRKTIWPPQPIDSIRRGSYWTFSGLWPPKRQISTGGVLVAGLSASVNNQFGAPNTMVLTPHFTLTAAIRWIPFCMVQ